MAWVPSEDKVLSLSEEIVLKYNPDWKGCGYNRLNVNDSEWQPYGFKVNDMTVFDFNLGAIKWYEKVGLKKEKFIENASKSSTGYWNLYEMGILKDEWIKNKAT